ncbi:YbaL family putative K(+) efflux transporter [Aquabacterium sp.]|uniref:YbaL family putative K(+) efflux transporter n=1 Tax=Aquabacterium sp. TaxID=1872578 RepID=UPI002B539D35|nr:YbaL family putative K(+) efflux transporter [Aquabacterium sp.]HSW05125.1 YbaL family putative K(+) efflux transporter [Aquabacterium sp.]
MHHSVPLITTIASALGLALMLGFIAARLKLPALVGYLLAGIVIGPATPGYVADVGIASQLAEIGVMLLMFGVGLHFSLADLMAVRKIALPGAVVQMGVATAMGMAVAHWWGWPLGAGLVFGLALSVASTVVLLKALEGRGALESVNGRIAVGWLVVEDLAMVLVLVLLPALAGMLGGQAADGAAEPGSLWRALGRTLLEVGVFVALMLVVGRRLFPWLLWQVTKTGSRELFTLCVVAAAVTIAYGASALFGVSFALGAFFAGMVLRESEFSHRAAEESLPLRDAFSVLFFVSVGMLFEPRVLVDRPLQVLAVVGIIVLGKSVAAGVLVLLFRYPLNTALTVSASLAQIGEFSFILAALGVSLKLLPPEGQSLILAGALISITLNPLLFTLVEPAQRWIRARSALARQLERSDDPLAELPTSTAEKYLARQVVLVGYGRVGRHVAAALMRAGVPFVVADINRERVEALRAQGLPAVAGDASDPAVLVQAHIALARVLVIAVPDAVGAPKMIATARALNPAIETIVRCHNEDEARLLQALERTQVYVGEQALAEAMVRHLLAGSPAPHGVANAG